MFQPDRRRAVAARCFFSLIVALGLALSASPAPLAQERDGGSVTDLERQAEEGRERAEELRDKARALAEEVRALRSESVSLARRAQKLESELSRLETTFKELKAREADKLAALKARRAQLSQTLAALQRIAMQPPEAVVMSSQEPLDVVRGAMMLGKAVPAIEERARTLRGELADLRDLRRQMERQRARMAETRGRLKQQRESLRDVMTRKRELRQKLVGRSREARERASSLASRAETMRELMAEIRTRPDPAPDPAPEPEAARKSEPDRAQASAAEARDTNDRSVDADGAKPPLPPRKPAEIGTQQARLARPDDIRSFPDRRSSLRMPASGEVVTRYGEKIRRAGGASASKGIAIETRNGARVVAPYDGKVAYAGPFKGYGRILIIEHGDRYHSLLAGLDRIDAIVGQWVLAGEPVGLMSRRPSRTPKLYMELRRTGRPVNPLPWLAQTGNKVKG